MIEPCVCGLVLTAPELLPPTRNNQLNYHAGVLRSDSRMWLAGDSDRVCRVDGDSIPMAGRHAVGEVEQVRMAPPQSGQAAHGSLAQSTPIPNLDPPAGSFFLSSDSTPEGGCRCPVHV